MVTGAGWTDGGSGSASGAAAAWLDCVAAGCEPSAGAGLAAGCCEASAGVTAGAGDCAGGCADCWSAACCAAALMLTSRAAVIIHFEVRITLFSRLLLTQVAVRQFV